MAFLLSSLLLISLQHEIQGCHFTSLMLVSFIRPDQWFLPRPCVLLSRASQMGRHCPVPRSVRGTRARSPDFFLTLFGGRAWPLTPWAGYRRVRLLSHNL